MTNTVFDDQARFMQACGQTTTEINPEQAMMYATLINEELQELDEAAAAGNDVEEFDAVLDLLVVVIGYGLSRGFPMQQGWNEVMRSNMSKVGADGKVLRREDGKILKPATFSEPDLTTILVNNF